MATSAVDTTTISTTTGKEENTRRFGPFLRGVSPPPVIASNTCTAKTFSVERIMPHGPENEQTTTVVVDKNKNARRISDFPLLFIRFPLEIAPQTRTRGTRPMPPASISTLVPLQRAEQLHASRRRRRGLAPLGELERKTATPETRTYVPINEQGTSQDTETTSYIKAGGGKKKKGKAQQYLLARPPQSKAARQRHPPYRAQSAVPPLPPPPFPILTSRA